MAAIAVYYTEKKLPENRFCIVFTGTDNMSFFKKISAWNKKFTKLQVTGHRGQPTPIEDCAEERCQCCGTVYLGHYCPSCGQESGAKRFSTRQMIHSIFISLTGSDNVFLNTCVDLLYRPGYMIRDYICGRRTIYFKPISMLLCLLAIFALSSYLVDNAYSPFSIDGKLNIEENVHSTMMMHIVKWIEAVMANKVIAALVSAFICVIPFKWVFSRCQLKRNDGTSSPLNLAEHFYTLVYISCIQMLVSIVMVPFALIDGATSLLQLIGLLLEVVNIWVYKQLLGIGWIKSTLLVLAALAIMWVVVALVTALVFGIVYGIDATMK